jgi:hypothetical protein
LDSQRKPQQTITTKTTNLGVAAPNSAILFCWPKRGCRKGPSPAAGMVSGYCTQSCERLQHLCVGPFPWQRYAAVSTQGYGVGLVASRAVKPEHQNLSTTLAADGLNCPHSTPAHPSTTQVAPLANHDHKKAPTEVETTKLADAIQAALTMPAAGAAPSGYSCEQTRVTRLPAGTGDL